ncbi:rhodanese-like domain-containing protein [Aurantibacter sp.]|uniref:rhodanese-like domain-containing protein n=1 Tax=Aurantibacter sp. TaxID=2807103 RepID=UPI0035C7C96D
MKKVVGFLAVILFFSCIAKDDKTIQLVTQEEMELILKEDQVQLVDVRTLKEFNAGSILNAKNIDFLSDDFEVQIKELDKSKPVIVFCQKGGRSAKCAKKMKDLGFTKIYDLEGGYSKWKPIK